MDITMMKIIHGVSGSKLILKLQLILILMKKQMIILVVWWYTW